MLILKTFQIFENYYKNNSTILSFLSNKISKNDFKHIHLGTFSYIPYHELNFKHIQALPLQKVHSEIVTSKGYDMGPIEAEITIEIFTFEDFIFITESCDGGPHTSDFTVHIIKIL